MITARMVVPNGSVMLTNGTLIRGGTPYWEIDDSGSSLKVSDSEYREKWQSRTSHAKTSPAPVMSRNTIKESNGEEELYRLGPLEQVSPSTGYRFGIVRVRRR